MGLAEVGIILYVLLWIIALVDIMRSKFIKRRYELMWLLIVFLVPFGVIAYFAFGGKQKMKKAMLILLFVFMPFAGLYAGSDEEQQTKFQEYISEGDYFRCIIPEGWHKWESDFGLSQSEKKVYGIVMFGPAIADGLKARISVHYYAEGNLVHKTADRFIETHSKPVFGPGTEIPGSKYSRVADTVVARRKAKKFEQQTFDFIDHVYDPKSGRFYTPIDPKKIPVIEKFIVIPTKEGYYVLHYYAPLEISEANFKAFEEVVKSFKPNVEGK